MLGRPDHQADRRDPVREHHTQLVRGDRVGASLVIRLEMDVHVRQPGDQELARRSIVLVPSGTATSLALPIEAIRPLRTRIAARLRARDGADQFAVATGGGRDHAAFRPATLRRAARLDFRHRLVDKEMRPVSNERSGRPAGVPDIAFDRYPGKTEPPRLHYTPVGNPSIIVLLDLTKVG